MLSLNKWHPMRDFPYYQLNYDGINCSIRRTLDKEYKIYSYLFKGQIYKKKYKLVRNVLKHTECAMGYLEVSLRIGKSVKKMKIHRIIAIHFIKNPDSKPFINHKNGDKKDNNIKNLEWCTHMENMRHAIKSGLNKTRAGKPNKSPEEVRNIIKLYTEIKSARKTGILLNTSTGVVRYQLVKAGLLKSKKNEIANV